MPPPVLPLIVDCVTVSVPPPDTVMPPPVLPLIVDCVTVSVPPDAVRPAPPLPSILSTRSRGGVRISSHARRRSSGSTPDDRHDLTNG